MFESALTIETPGRRSPLFISFTIQTVAVAGLMILPLYYVEQLTQLPTMPVPVYAPKLPHMKIIRVVREAASAFTPRLTQPSIRLPFRPPLPSFAATRTGPVITDFGMPFPDGAVAIPVDLPFVPPARIAASPVEAKPVVKPVAKSGPQRVGGAVQAAKLIHQVRPAYPPLAKQARIQGTVRLQAVIARDGSIQNLVLASGHPLLVPSAMDAVRQWRYSPTTLNGETVEVLTQIDVNFTLQ